MSESSQTETDTTNHIHPERSQQVDHSATPEEKEADDSKKSENLPNAFSRRDALDVSKPIKSTSIYAEQDTEVPAWMRGNKYDKYGLRSHAPNSSAAQTGSTDDKYAKYALSRNTPKAIKRPREEEDPREREERLAEERRNNRYREGRREADEDNATDSYSPYIINVANPGGVRQRQYQTFHSKGHTRNSNDINSIVRSHYNQRAHQSKIQGPRTASPIYKLRNFNNVIKYMILGGYSRNSEAKDSELVILDLCCGKGGDLNKCEFMGVSQYIGIDISDASVKEGFSRYYQNKARFIPKGPNARKDSRKYHFDACFATGDCFTDPVPSILEPNFPGIIENVFPVDCVLIQFALHYSFETEEKVDTLLTNVTKSLRPGGRFVATIPLSDFIRKKIVNQEVERTADGKYKFGNELYSVTFDEEPPKDGVFRPPFGNKYVYSLKDAIDNVPEYVVPFETLRAKCELFGLILKYKENFVDMYNKEIPKFFPRLNKNLIEGLKRSDGKYGLEGAEKEATAFYLAFAFEKL